MCTQYVAQREQPLTSSLQTLTIPFAIFVSACLATETQEIQSRPPSLSPCPLTTIVDDTVVQYPLCVVQELPRGLVAVRLHFLHRKRQHSAQGVGRKKTRRREEEGRESAQSAGSLLPHLLYLVQIHGEEDVLFVVLQDVIWHRLLENLSLPREKRQGGGEGGG